MLESQITSPIRDDKDAVKRESVFSLFLKQLNTNNLALSLFVALALLSGMQGRETVDSSGCKDPNKGPVTIHGSALWPNFNAARHTGNQLLPTAVPSFFNTFKSAGTLRPFVIGMAGTVVPK